MLVKILLWYKGLSLHFSDKPSETTRLLIVFFVFDVVFIVTEKVSVCGEKYWID